MRSYNADDLTYIGHTLGRQPFQHFGIRQRDRLSHCFLIGKTGTGKSTLIKNMILQDIVAGRGVCLLDPHGDLVEAIYKSIPNHRKSDVIYMNVPEVPNVYGYNPLRFVKADKRSLAASGLLEIFKKQWEDSWGARMEHILRNCILTLLERPGSDLSHILHLLVDREFREKIVPHIKNQQVKFFWESEYAKYTPPFRLNAIAPIQNKVSAFLTDPRIRETLIVPKVDLSFRQLMDEQKIILINLAKGQVGEDTSSLLGSIFATTIALAAFSRQDMPDDQRPPFMLYMDEFQTFTTRILADMAAELRKFQTGLVIATQILDIIQPDIRHAMLGNTGTLISFRLSAKDASFISKEFAPVFRASDLVSLPNHRVGIRLMIGGVPSKPFSAATAT